MEKSDTVAKDHIRCFLCSLKSEGYFELEVRN